MKKCIYLMLGLLIAGGGSRTNGDDIQVNEIRKFPGLTQGRWSSLARTKGGLGSQWKFTEDGETTYSFGALVDFKYEVDGNQIKMIALNPDLKPKGEMQISKFLIDDKTLTLEPNSSVGRQVMTRSGAPHTGADQVMGDWTYTHYTGGTAVMRYFQDGICQLSVPFQELKGTYRKVGNDISIQLPGRDPIKASFLPSEDILTITTITNCEHRKQRRYIRYE